MQNSTENSKSSVNLEVEQQLKKSDINLTKVEKQKLDSISIPGAKISDDLLEELSGGGKLAKAFGIVAGTIGLAVISYGGGYKIASRKIDPARKEGFEKGFESGKNEFIPGSKNNPIVEIHQQVSQDGCLDNGDHHNDVVTRNGKWYRMVSSDMYDQE